MEILEAFDLVGTLRRAAELAGCDHKTVAHYVAEREAGGGEWQLKRRPCPRTDPHAEKIAEWVERSQGKVRADKVHERLVAMGYRGLGAHHTAGGRPRQGGLAGRAPPRAGALGPRAGPVDAVGLRRGPGDRRAGDLAVLRLARLVSLPGRRCRWPTAPCPRS